MNLCASCGHGRGFHEKQHGCALCLNARYVFVHGGGRYTVKLPQNWPAVCREYKEVKP